MVSSSVSQISVLLKASHSVRTFQDWWIFDWNGPLHRSKVEEVASAACWCCLCLDPVSKLCSAAFCCTSQNSLKSKGGLVRNSKQEVKYSSTVFYPQQTSTTAAKTAFFTPLVYWFYRSILYNSTVIYSWIGTFTSVNTEHFITNKEGCSGGEYKVRQRTEWWRMDVAVKFSSASVEIKNSPQP